MSDVAGDETANVLTTVNATLAPYAPSYPFEHKSPPTFSPSIAQIIDANQILEEFSIIQENCTEWASNDSYSAINRVDKEETANDEPCISTSSFVGCHDIESEISHEDTFVKGSLSFSYDLYTKRNSDLASATSTVESNMLNYVASMVQFSCDGSKIPVSDNTDHNNNRSLLHSFVASHLRGSIEQANKMQIMDKEKKIIGLSSTPDDRVDPLYSECTTAAPFQFDHFEEYHCFPMTGEMTYYIGDPFAVQLVETMILTGIREWGASDTIAFEEESSVLGVVVVNDRARDYAVFSGTTNADLSDIQDNARSMNNVAIGMIFTIMFVFVGTMIGIISQRRRVKDTIENNDESIVPVQEDDERVLESDLADDDSGFGEM